MNSGFSNSGSGVTIDKSVPHSARIWNYWLGGKDNYAVDREAGDAWVAVHPEIIPIARETRAFLGRAVGYLAREVGIRQFLDVGTGLPTFDNTHELAQRIAPEARVVYVDNDPLVLAHARALLTSTPEGSTRYLHADMHESAELIKGAAEILDLDQPVAVFFMGVLGHVADIDEVRALVARIMAYLPSGSHLTLCDGTHAADSAGSSAFEKAEEEYIDSGATPYYTRTPDEVATFFDGLEWVDPGFVSVPLWRPAEGTSPTPINNHGGMARKP
jgi:hypothetical protein